MCTLIAWSTPEIKSNNYLYVNLFIFAGFGFGRLSGGWFCVWALFGNFEIIWPLKASTYVPTLDRTTSKQFHHLREGNLTRDAKCVVCKKGCYSAECFSGFRCQWCNLSVHSTCYRQLRPQCDFGALRKIMLPPNAVTTPRSELPMDLLLNIHTTAGMVRGEREGI
jgi:hypothetical protein